MKKKKGKKREKGEAKTKSNNALVKRMGLERKGGGGDLDTLGTRKSESKQAMQNRKEKRGKMMVEKEI